MNIRNIDETDKTVLAEMIAKDDHHRDTTTSDFFFEERTKCLVYEHGEHRLFARFSNALRLDLQFDNDDTLFNAKTILAHFSGLMKWAKDKGFSEIIFCSSSPELIAFMQKRFGFEALTNEYRIVL